MRDRDARVFAQRAEDITPRCAERADGLHGMIERVLGERDAGVQDGVCEGKDGRTEVALDPLINH